MKVKNVICKLACILFVTVMGVVLSKNIASVATKADLESKVTNRTDNPIMQTYYADYDSDGAKEAFIYVANEEYDENGELWFSSEK